MKQITLNESEVPILEAQKLAEFNAIYYLESHFIDISSTLSLGLQPENTVRKCRYCQKDSMSVAFKNFAHLVPELMGFKYLTTRYECDGCNKFFGKRYDNELAKFIGSGRTIAGIDGKKGIPKTESISSNVFVQSERNKNMLKLRMGGQFPIEDITFNHSDNSIEMSFQEPPFTPLNVIKSLYKIGYGVLRDDELLSYKCLHRFLMNRHTEKGGKDFAFPYWINYLFPYSINLENAISLFSKKNGEVLDCFFDKILIIKFANNIYQIPLSSDKNIEFALENKELSMPQYPILIDRKLHEPYGGYSIKVQDSSSPLISKPDKTRVKIHFADSNATLKVWTSPVFMDT